MVNKPTEDIGAERAPDDISCVKGLDKEERC